MLSENKISNILHDVEEELLLPTDSEFLRKWSDLLGVFNDYELFKYEPHDREFETALNNISSSLYETFEVFVHVTHRLKVQARSREEAQDLMSSIEFDDAIEPSYRQNERSEVSVEVY
jgi:hypothetical protein